MADRTVTVRLQADDKLSPALAKASGSSTALAAGLGKSSKASDELGKSTGKTASQLERIRPTAALAALGVGTLGVGAAFQAAYRSVTTFDTAMSAMRSYLEPTTAEFNQLRDAALEMGKTSSFSASEAARSMTELGKAGVSTKDILSGGLVGALNLAAAGQMDVGEAAEAAAAAMAQFSLSGKDIPHIADLLAAGAGKAQGSVRDMTLAMKQVGSVAANAGLSIEETTAGLTAFANAGVVGSDAGTSFKSMLQRLTPQSKEAQKEMERLGISAYDANGNFIGLSKFAGVLQTALSGLTDEQRSASMGIIFGSDAVRAATVLYKEGAAGITHWTNEVTDAGYAARVAAELNNNLTGDLRKLGNTIESMLLARSGGLVDFFRIITQGVTGLITVVDGLPGPVLAAGAALVAFTAVRPHFTSLVDAVQAGSTRVQAGFSGMGAAFQSAHTQIRAAVAAPIAQHFVALGDSTVVAAAKANTMTQAYRPLTASLAAASVAAASFKTAASGVIGALGGPWGVALMAAGAAVAYFAQQKAQAAARSQELAAAVDADTKALGANTSALGENTRSVVVNRLEQDGMLAAAQQLGISTRDYTDAILGNAEALARVNAVLDPHLAGVAEMAQQYDATGFRVDDTSQKASFLKGTLRELTGEIAQSSDAAKRKAEAMGQDAGAMGVAGAASDSLTGKTNSLAASTKDAEAATKALDSALKALSGFLSADAAVTNYTGKLMELKKATDGSSAAMNVQTASGRAARAQMNDLTSSAVQVIKTMMDQGASHQQVAAKANEMAAQIDKAGRSAGYSASETKKYTDQLRAVPGTVHTRVTANVSAAYAAVGGFVAWAQRQSVTIHAQTGVRYNPGLFADGGIVEAYARGGIRDIERYANGGRRGESHVAQIAPAGAWRVWAEPETGGEAYIPLSPAKRGQSMAILEEVARRFGRRLEQYADGGTTYGRARPEYAAGRQARGTGGVTTVNVTNHYPVAEPASTTINRGLQHAAAIGLGV